MTWLSSPAASAPVSNGPSASWRAHRPHRIRKASPEPTATPACASHASRSATVMRSPGSRYGTPLQARDVVEDAAGQNAVPHRQDGVPGRSPLHRDRVGNRVPVPHLPVEEAMGEAVDVGRAGAVDARIVDGVGGARRRRADHPPLQRTGVVDAPLGIRNRCERHREPFRHQVRGLAPLLRGDQVERAHLVIGSPAAPVGQLVEPRVVLRPADERRILVLPGQRRRTECHDERHDGAAPHHPAPVPRRHALSPSVPDTRNMGDCTAIPPRGGTMPAPSPVSAIPTREAAVGEGRPRARERRGAG